ncbi:MAG: aconitase X catalytic domain-containing protein [Candidatus Micrarchaeota archaeon]
MILTKQEQKMLEGEHGEAVQQSMEILVALGKIYDAEKMIQVKSAQISGVSYKTIGDAGLAYLQDLASKHARVKIPSFLNPAGMDRRQWKEMKIPEEFAKKQIEILDAYTSMHIMPTCTCAPYEIGIRPRKHDHIAWSESSAVSFTNSVLGARTNREGGPSALAAAICGITPSYGLHLDENRVSELVIDVECKLNNASDFAALGVYVGKLAKNKHPAFKGVRKSMYGSRIHDEDLLKSLGAAMAASGSVALFYVEDTTPEYAVSKKPEKISFTEKELNAARKELNKCNEKPEIITLGCPHASLEQIREVAKLLRKKKLTCELWVCTSQQMKKRADAYGYAAIIEKAGGKLIADTCMVVCPLETIGYKITGADSGKAAKYLESLCKQKVVFNDMKTLIENNSESIKK